MENNWIKHVTYLPATIRHNPDLTSIDKLLYSEVLSLASYFSTVFITHEVKQDLASLYSVNVRTVTAAVNKFVKLGYIKPVDNKEDYYLIGVK